MRIIGGTFKGIKLFEAFDKNTRPLKDLVKESILNILEHSKDSRIKLNNSLVLDLFAGTGSFGLECISRGSKKVYFVENYDQSIEILEKNIKKLKSEKKTRIFNEDVFNFFKNQKLKDEKMDLIFLDPPYKENKIVNLFSIIFDLNLLKKNGVVIVHRNKKSNDNGFGNFKIIDKRIYGVSKIIFLKSN